MIGNVAAVFLFEWKRALTWSRNIWWAMLAAFPVFIILLVRFSIPESQTEHHSEFQTQQDEVWRNLCAWILFALVPMLVSMLGTLMWTTPAVSAELERRSWIYLAVRPNGATAVLLGKYLTAVTWVIPPALLGLALAVPLANTGDTLRILLSMIGLVLLSCPAYAAIYLLIGVIIPRRGTVLAVTYTLLFELIISFVPAVINKITIQYRLRALAATWCKLKILSPRESGALSLIGDEPVWLHIVALVALTLSTIVAAILILRASEFSSAAESDT